MGPVNVGMSTTTTSATRLNITKKFRRFARAVITDVAANEAPTFVNMTRTEGSLTNG